MTAHRRIRSKLEEGQRAYGVTIQLPSPDCVEIAGHAGYDYVWIDAEHGTMGISEIGVLVRAADAVGVDSIVRVPDHSPSFIQRVLDAGATGIMAPHIRTVEDAVHVVEACKFAPGGNRGACPSTRAVGHMTRDWPTDYRRANEDVLVFGLIEDPEGVENVEAIAAGSGLDGLLFGPFDLAMTLGFEGDVTHPDLAAMSARLIAATRSARIEYVSILGWEFDGIDGLARSGSRIVTVTGDRGALANSFQGALEKSRTRLDRAAQELTA